MDNLATDPMPSASPLVRYVTPDNPVDLFIAGITVVDKPLPACTRENREDRASQYARACRTRNPRDRFTAYLYGHKTTVQVPIEKHFYLRVPDAWIVHQRNPKFINGFLDHLVQTICPSNARGVRSTIRATLILRRYGIGYKPKVTNPPTTDSASFPFLHVFCSSPFLYNLLRSKLSSNTTRRKYWSRDFYSHLFRGGAANKYLLVFRNPYGIKSLSNVTSSSRILGDPQSNEWFVAHETDLNSDTMTLSNLGITSNGWVRVTKGELYDNRLRSSAVSNSTFEIVGPVEACGISLDEIEETRCSDLVAVALDIECQSATGGFPQATNPGDVVNYVGLVKYSTLDMNQSEKWCVCLGATTARPSDDGKACDTAHMEIFQHETELLNYVCDFTNRHDVDIYQTYNGNSFDWKYMDQRATLAGFIQQCDSFEEFWNHLESYHRADLVYKDLKGQLADLEESFFEYKEMSQSAFNEQSRQVYGEINETLGNARRKMWREPQPLTVHRVMWGIWPKEFEDTPANLKADNEQVAFAKAKQFYEYFHDQPPITYHYMHRLRAKKARLVYKSMGSKAMGENYLMYPDLARIHVDQFTFFKNSLFRLSDYRLESVATHFLKVGKNDMPYKKLFADYASGDPDLRRDIADYCVQDCDLLRRLDQKTNITLTYIFLFKMTRTPIIDVSLRGQQIRVFNCLYKKAVSIGAIFNSKRAHKILEEYQGATVLDPVPGLHGGPVTWVQVLDFQSLYPSIIIAMLLCMMNLVLPDDLNYVLALEKAGKIPPLHRIRISKDTTYYFSKNPNCIIASELRRLLEKRKGVKRVMKSFKKKKNEKQTELDLLTMSFLKLKLGQVEEAIEEALGSTDTSGGGGGGGSKDSFSLDMDALKVELNMWTSRVAALLECETSDPEAVENRRKELAAHVAHNGFEYTMQDVLQLSIKIVMNSFYGFFGVKEGMMPGMQPIAVSTTFYGRDYIQRTKRFLQNLFDTHPEYEELNMEVVYGDSVTGDTALHVRYKGHKFIRRIDELHTLLPIEEQGWIEERGKHVLYLSGLEVWSDANTGYTPIRRLIKHDTTKAIVRVVTHTGIVDCTTDHSLLTPTGVEIKPADVQIGTPLLHVNDDELLLCASTETYSHTTSNFNQHQERIVADHLVWNSNRGAIERLFRKLGCFDEPRRIQVRGKQVAAGIWIMARRLGFHVALDACQDQPDLIYLHIDTAQHNLNEEVAGCVKKMWTLKPAGTASTVYDLETETHHFHVGPGNLVVHNTDSVFVKTWPITGLANAIKIGEDMGERTTRDEFHGDIILEFEKVANPHLAFDEKKSYLQRVWTVPVIDAGYIYISGVAEKRRDNAAFTRKLYHTCRDTIIPPIPKGATSIHFETIADIEDRCASTLAKGLGVLEDDGVPLEDYVITKGLSRAPEHYKSPVPAHVALALRIKQRIRDGLQVRMPPISGDRLPYVVCTHATSAKVADKVEDLDYFQEEGVKTIDRQYYAKAATRSITQLYSSIMDVKPFFEATHRALDLQVQISRGQQQLITSDVGARSVNYERLFLSRQRKRVARTQLDFFGNPVKDVVAKKKKKKPKKRKKKPIQMRSLF